MYSIVVSEKLAKRIDAWHRMQAGCELSQMLLDPSFVELTNMFTTLLANSEACSP